MSIRLRTVLVITAVTSFIIIFSVLFGIIFVSRNVTVAQETDIQVAADIADLYISAEIGLLFLRAAELAKELEMQDDAHLPGALAELYGIYPEFIGIAVFDADAGRLSHTGRTPAPENALESTHIADALHGRRTLKSTYSYGDNVVFYAAVPIPYSQSRLLAVTIPGTYFREKLLDIEIWETGHVFMVDDEGIFVSNPREHWVLGRNQVSIMAQEDDGFELLNVTVDKMRNGETGIGYYPIYGVERVCAYKPVAGSEDGWSLGAIAPLPESPFRFVNTGLLVVGLVALLLSIVAAVIASTFVKRPFERIAALKEESERNSMYKTQFLASMSHELRTPMNSILGITEMQLQNDSLDADVRKALEKIKSSGDLLLGIISNILDLIKSETGEQDLASIDFEVSDLVDEAASRTQITREPMPYGSILIVDDIEANIYVARGLMLPYRLMIDTAGSGREAIKKIESGHVYDIVFMDHMMPEMDGIETVKNIRELGYTHPIIALTANAVAGQADMFLQNGFDDFIAKPIDIRRLDDILCKWVRDRHPLDARVIDIPLEQSRSEARISGVDIPGLDIAKGLERFDGNEEVYLKVLGSFTESARRLLDTVGAAGNVKPEEYQIAVHGLKGMCFDIFADKLGEAAKKLEEAAKSGDTDYISTHNESLVDAISALTDGIEGVLQSMQTQNPKPKKDFPDAGVLSELCKACKNYSIDEIDAAMREIDKYQYESDYGLTEWLHEMVELSEFSEIAAKLSASYGKNI